MEKVLKQDLKGIVRPPALAFGNADKSLQEISHYEVNPVEPLHDLKGHIKNVWEELPCILPQPLNEKFKAILAGYFREKDTIRGDATTACL